MMDYAYRRGRIIKKLKRGGIDSFFTLHPPNLHYLSPFKGKEGGLLITTDTTFLLVDSRYITQARSELEGLKNIHISEIKGSFLSTLSKLFLELKVEGVAVEEEHITISFFEKLKRRCKRVNVHPIKGWVENLRMVKTEEEIIFIQRACEIVDRAFEKIRNSIRWGMKEIELVNELEYLLRKETSDPLPFLPIIAGGIRSSFPHAYPTEKTINKGEFLIIDFGASFNGYCCDLTRTIGENIMDGRKREIYKLVLEAQQLSIKAVKPGVRASTIYKIAQDVFERENMSKFFIHGLGHGVGLEVHEKPNLSLKNSLKLKERMVLTIEPGLYIPEEYGVRIEDTVLVTSKGCQVLTSAPKDYYGT